MFSYLTPDNVFEKYTAAKFYTEQLTEPFPEFERIAHNRPHDGIQNGYPKTTDGTTASIVRKTPRRALQQIPTGVIQSDNTDDYLPIVAEFVYTNKILPFANAEYDLMQKCWVTIEAGLTYGSQCTYTPFINHDGEFTPDMTLPYWGDVFIQPGKKSAADASYVFIRTWYQPEDIEALIDREKKLKKSAKERGEAYDSSWNLKALEEVKDATSIKDDKAQTPSEEERNITSEGVEIITGYQNGVGAEFITFCNDIVVRVEKNPDPRGKMPVDWFFAEIDGYNPLGRGVVELIGPLQNLIDSDMQMYQFNRALMLAPPLIKRGTFSKSKIVYKPNHIIDLGNDPNARIEPLDVDTSAVTDYPNLYGLQKSQILNLVSSPDSTTSAEVGNPGFSKTHAGVKQMDANVSIDDNYVRKMFEAWFEHWSETAINLYFAKRQGVEDLQLDDRTAHKLTRLLEKGIPVPGYDPNTRVITIDYDQATPALKFRIDASTSKMKTDGEQLEALSMLLERLEASPLLTQLIVAGNEDKIIGAWNSIVSASGIENPELLSVDIEEWKEQQAMQQQMQQEQMMQQQAMEQQMIDPMQEAMMREQQAIPAEVMPPEAGVSPEDEALAMELADMGYDDNTIAEAIDMAEKGYATDDILQALMKQEQTA